MRRYRNDNSNDVIEIKCNVCGKNLKIENGLIVEGNMSIDYSWGYFSDMDGEVHKFDICQECYKKLSGAFVIPVDIEESRELL